MVRFLEIAPADNVAVALEAAEPGTTVEGVPGAPSPLEAIPRGHKMALRPIEAGEDIVKYGLVIGHATQLIQAGEWVHLQNMATNLSGEVDYVYEPTHPEVEPQEPRSFMGFRLPDGRAAIRNEVWVIPTVGCVNEVARSIADDSVAEGSVEGIRSFLHPYGCSQVGSDHERTKKVLAALAHHPNAAGVLFVSLGCENCTHVQLLEELGEFDPRYVRFLNCQEVDDEHEAGLQIVAELVDAIKDRVREPMDVSELVVGLKCGGSDGLSGITANPTIGRVSDLLVAQGATTVLSEVPEMFGAEKLILGRCADEEVFSEATAMLNGFKDYFLSHGETVYENPSPGNKDGGITTLEDKSCGCVQKGGTSPIMGVVDYGDQVVRHGLNLLCSPGNDMVSTTALTAAGCHLILFSTGRGTPFGAPAPTLKVATNDALAAAKPGWIDFSAGGVASGDMTLDEAAQGLFDVVIACADGRPTSAERRHSAEIAIWKDGVTL